MTQTLSRSSDAAINPLDLRLRPATPADEAFLKSVHDAGRAWEFNALRGQVDDAMIETILQQQYSAQHDVYFNAFTLAKYAVVEWCGHPVGRLYADFRETEIRLLDINILPPYRGRRIGEILIRSLCGMASAQQIPMTLQVHPMNAARQLYKRLGFRELGVKTDQSPGAGAFIELEWRDLMTTPPRPA